MVRFPLHSKVSLGKLTVPKLLLTAVPTLYVIGKIAAYSKQCMNVYVE